MSDGQHISSNYIHASGEKRFLTTSESYDSNNSGYNYYPMGAYNAHMNNQFLNDDERKKMSYSFHENINHNHNLYSIGNKNVNSSSSLNNNTNQLEGNKKQLRNHQHTNSDQMNYMQNQNMMYQLQRMQQIQQNNINTILNNNLNALTSSNSNTEKNIICLDDVRVLIIFLDFLWQRQTYYCHDKKHPNQVQ